MIQTTKQSNIHMNIMSLFIITCLFKTIFKRRKNMNHYYLNKEVHVKDFLNVLFG